MSMKFMEAQSAVLNLTVTGEGQSVMIDLKITR
jgi:hypothetical protein